MSKHRSPWLQLQALLLPILLAACHAHDDDHSHGAGGHGHGSDDHGHGHDEAEAERPDLAVTAYEDGLELFMEYPSFVVGEASPLIAHFTDVRDANRFAAVTKGGVTATLIYADDTKVDFSVAQPLRAGVFKPIVAPTKPGRATLVLRLEGAQVSGVVSAGPVEVFSSIEAAIAAAPSDDPAPAEEVVGYLKETQWKTEYATALAERRPLKGGVRATGEIKPVPGQAVELSAPVAGKLIIRRRVPHIGLKVKKGDLLVSVLPLGVAATQDVASLELQLSRARSERERTKRELARAEDLVAAQALPKKRLDDALAAHEVAAAGLRAAKHHLEAYQTTKAGTRSAHSLAFTLRSPIDGVVAAADVTPGAVVSAGTRLVSVVNTERLWLQARVFESDVALLREDAGASFSAAGFERTFVIDETNGRRVAVGAVVDPTTRTVPVIFEFDNSDGALKPGMFAKVRLFTGGTVDAVAIPETALVDDSGRWIVFVMEGGESFFKRRVRLGVRSGGLVQILDGVSAGERVVSQGAYEIKLATASGAIPEHGHQH